MLHRCKNLHKMPLTIGRPSATAQVVRAGQGHELRRNCTSTRGNESEGLLHGWPITDGGCISHTLFVRTQQFP